MRDRHVGALGVVERVTRSARACPDSRGGPATRRRSRCDQSVDDRLRMDHHVDRGLRGAEQVVRLDQLEPLVHQGGAVDRDLAAHLPGRMGERLLRVTPSSVGAVMPRNGPPHGGEHEPVDGAGPLAGQQLVESASARSRPASAGAPVASASAITSSPPTTRLSLLASARSIPSPNAATVGPRPADPTRALSTRSQSPSVISSTSPSGRPEPRPRTMLGGPRSGIRSARATRIDAVTGGLVDEQFEALRCGETHHLELGAALRSRRAPACRSSRSSRL